MKHFIALAVAGVALFAALTFIQQASPTMESVDELIEKNVPSAPVRTRFTNSCRRGKSMPDLTRPVRIHILAFRTTNVSGNDVL
jgi:hypothetical protein